MNLVTIFIAHNFTKNSFAAMSTILAEKLSNNGFRVIFISHKPRFTTTNYIKNKNGELIVISWPSKKRPTTLRDWLWFLKIYYKYKPKFTIGHFVGSNIMTTVSKVFSFGKTKTIVYYHTLSKAILVDSSKSKFEYYIKKRRKKFFYKHLSDVVVCPSQLGCEDFNNFYSIKKGVEIVNPMMDRFLKKENKNYINILISYLGRLDSSKGVLEMIKGFNLFVNDKPSTKILLRLAGSGKLSKKIQKLAEKYDRISFIGRIEYQYVDKYISESQFIIIPSLYDNLPTVGLEALMNKTPILISEYTGLSKYLKDGHECFKFNPNIIEIKNVFEIVENNFSLISKMEINARTTYNKLFSTDVYYKNILKLLK